MFFKGISFSILISILATASSCVDKEICDFTDEICVTKAADLLLKVIIAGNEAWAMESLEQPYEKTIYADISANMHYTFTDVYLYGMKYCTIKKLKFDTNLSWHYYMICPRLILKSEYVEKGDVDSVPIESNGNASITYDNYHVSIHGETETTIGSDGKSHMNITNYEIDLMDVKDNAIHKFTNILSTDKVKSEKAHKYLNDNWKNMSGEILYPILQPFIDRLMNNINKFLAVVPKYELYYKNP